MAYYRGSSTPASRRFTAILMGIITLVMLFIGLNERQNYKKITEKCSEYEVGIVSDVDSERVYRRRGRSYTKYNATVTLSDDTALGRKYVSTGWTRHSYSNGNMVRVYFDPNDPSLFYVEGAGPDDGIAMFITCGILLVVTAVVFVQSKR